MGKFGTRGLALILACFAACSVAAESAAAPEQEGATRTDFVVRDVKSGKVALTGYIIVQTRGDEVSRDIVYLDDAKKEVQSEHSVYRAASLRVLNDQLRNNVLGYEAAIAGDDSQLKVHYRESASDSFEDRSMKWGASDYYPAVIDALVLRNWASLRQAKPLDFDLLIPQAGASIGMEFTYDGEQSIDGEKLAIVQLQPKFGLLKAIMPRIQYGYSIGGNPALRHYIGPSPFPKSRDEVEIRYSAPAEDAPAPVK